MNPSQNDSETFLSDVFQSHSKSPQQSVQKSSAQGKGPKLLSPIDFMQCPYEGNVISSAKVLTSQADIKDNFSRRFSPYFPNPAYRQPGLTYADVVKKHIFDGQQLPPKPANLESGSCVTFPNLSPHKVTSSLGFFETKSPSFTQKYDCLYGIPHKKITTFYCKKQCCNSIDPLNTSSRESSVSIEVDPILSSLNMLDDKIIIE